MHNYKQFNTTALTWGKMLLKFDDVCKLASKQSGWSTFTGRRRQQEIRRNNFENNYEAGQESKY